MSVARCLAQQRVRRGVLSAPRDYSRKPGFTETRLRPLARRREITFLPPWVFMRVRNPCIFDRLRRLGWNVRLGKVARPAFFDSVRPNRKYKSPSAIRPNRNLSQRETRRTTKDTKSHEGSDKRMKSFVI